MSHSCPSGRGVGVGEGEGEGEGDGEGEGVGVGEGEGVGVGADDGVTSTVGSAVFESAETVCDCPHELNANKAAASRSTIRMRAVCFFFIRILSHLPPKKSKGDVKKQRLVLLALLRSLAVV